MIEPSGNDGMMAEIAEGNDSTSFFHIENNQGKQDGYR